MLMIVIFIRENIGISAEVVNEGERLLEPDKQIG